MKKEPMEVKCTHCGADVERVKITKLVSCFDCKKIRKNKRTKISNALRK